MANMGYCRFQNTLKDLQDCWEHFGDEGLSPEEDKARQRMLELCRSIVESYDDSDAELLDSYIGTGTIEDVLREADITTE
jgi:hypothetical protein